MTHKSITRIILAVLVVNLLVWGSLGIAIPFFGASGVIVWLIVVLGILPLAAFIAVWKFIGGQKIKEFFR